MSGVVVSFVRPPANDDGLGRIAMSGVVVSFIGSPRSTTVSEVSA
jgi:hypothetical protein